MKQSSGFLIGLGIVLTATCLVICTLGAYIWFNLDEAQVQAIERICQENLFPLLGSLVSWAVLLAGLGALSRQLYLVRSA